MPDTEENTALVNITEDDLRSAGFPDGMKMAPGLAIFFNPRMYHQAKAVAVRLSEASGIVGKHLIGKPSACLAIVSRSITWNLDPFAVAQSTYETPGGKIGYEGKLVQAILENSGAVVGRITYEYKGNWEKLRGKFKMERSTRPGSNTVFPVASYTEADEEGLSVIVRCQVRGETEPREEEFWMREMHPRNSTLWATRPRQQICYAAVRAFANIAAPGLLMGIPFDVEPGGFYDGTDMQNVGESNTAIPARPQRGQNAFDRPADDQPETGEAAQASDNAVDETEGPVAQAEPDPSDKPDETPVQRCMRLLPLCKGVNDVADLRASIIEEVLDDDDAVDEVNKACDARSEALTAPKEKPKPTPKKQGPK